LLGKGAFARVFLATQRVTGKDVAIKIIENSYMKDEYRK
jgi:serine/threonine protein kinase